MEIFNRFRTPILTGAGVVVFAIIVFVALIAPQGSKLSKLHLQETQLQAQQTQLQAQIAVLKRDKAQMASNCVKLSKALTEIPGAPSVDSFLQQVTALAVASGDPNTPTIAVTQAAGHAGGVSPIQVSLTLQGTYGQMSAFLKGLDTFPRLFTVTNISVTGGPIASGGAPVNPANAGYSLTMTGAVYYSPTPQTACGTSTAAAGSAAH
jgi:Tfp pilus assembly protein PilO